MTGYALARSIRGLLALSRAEVAVVGAFPYGIGVVFCPEATMSLFVSYYAFGVLVHLVGCAVNDIADSPTDRLDPARATSPLVSGDCSRVLAVGFAWTVGLCAAGFAGWLSDGSLGIFALLLMLLLIGVYGNALQKKFEGWHTFAVDFLFGVFIAAPVVVGVLMCEGHLSAGVLALSASLVMQGPMLNAMRGNLKDLRHDRSVGAHTVAVRLGVEQAASRGPVQLTMSFTRYCWFLFITAAAFLAYTGVWTMTAEPIHPMATVLFAGLVVSVVVAAVGMSFTVRHRVVRPAMLIRRVLFPFNIATLIAASAIRPSWEILVLCLGTYAWSVSFAALRRWQERTPPLRGGHRSSTEPTSAL